jgi:hypothetical protein
MNIIKVSQQTAAIRGTLGEGGPKIFPTNDWTATKRPGIGRTAVFDSTLI